MADEFDVEAMLEAPYRKDVSQKRNAHNVQIVIFKFVFYQFN